jgi:hypothetical protein
MVIMKSVLRASAIVAALSSNSFAAGESDLAKFAENARKFGTATRMEVCSMCNKTCPTEWFFEGKTVASRGNHRCSVLDELNLRTHLKPHYFEKEALKIQALKIQALQKEQDELKRDHLKVDYQAVMEAMEFAKACQKSPALELSNEKLLTWFSAPSYELDLSSSESPKIKVEPFIAFSTAKIASFNFELDSFLIPISKTSDETKKD